MIELKEGKRFEQVVQRIDPYGRLLHAWELTGGVSAQVTVLEIVRSDNRRQKMIVRQHGEVDRKQNPQIAADEFKLLSLLHSAGLAVPMPYYLDQSGEIFSTPYVVIEYIGGKTEFELSNVPDLIPQLAIALARIHQVDSLQFDLSFLPRQEQKHVALLRERPANVDASLNEGRVRDTLEAAWPFPQPDSPALLHGDFWPGNILWKDGQLAAVIDWEDAALGDPRADLANSRLEILWAFGIDAMQQFTDQYQAMTGIDFTNLPYWDLCAALRPVAKLAEWAPDAGSEKSMRERLRWFIAQAFEKLAIHDL